MRVNVKSCRNDLVFYSKFPIYYFLYLIQLLSYYINGLFLLTLTTDFIKLLDQKVAYLFKINIVNIFPNKLI